MSGLPGQTLALVFDLLLNYCLCFDKSHDERFLSAINVCILTVAPHFSCAAEPAFCYGSIIAVISLDGGILENIFCLEQLNNFSENLHSVS